MWWSTSWYHGLPVLCRTLSAAAYEIRTWNWSWRPNLSAASLDLLWYLVSFVLFARLKDVSTSVIVGTSFCRTGGGEVLPHHRQIRGGPRPLCAPQLFRLLTPLFFSLIEFRLSYIKVSVWNRKTKINRKKINSNIFFFFFVVIK